MTDVEEVKKDVRAVGYGIQELQQFIDWNGECSVPEIFIQQTLGIIDGDELKLIIGGFGPQYLFQFHSERLRKRSTESMQLLTDVS